MEISCDNKFGNLINHSSNRDGTIRSAKTCYIIKKFNPTNAGDVAEILIKNRAKKVKTIYDKEYPMFFNDKRLVNFCLKTDKKEWLNYCVSHIDSVDLSADLWKLSPIIHKKYSKKIVIDSPSFGRGTFEGWHNFKKDIVRELSKRKGDIGFY